MTVQASGVKHNQREGVCVPTRPLRRCDSFMCGCVCVRGLSVSQVCVCVCVCVCVSLRQYYCSLCRSPASLSRVVLSLKHPCQPHKLHPARRSCYLATAETYDQLSGSPMPRTEQVIHRSCYRDTR